MPLIHVFEVQGDGRIRVVMHRHTSQLNTLLGQLYPDYDAGKNHVGVSWKDAGLATGRLGSTAMVEGNGVGQITTAEKAQVESGDVVEINTNVKVDQGDVTEAGLNALATRAATDWAAEFGRALRFYGHTQG